MPSRGSITRMVPWVLLAASLAANVALIGLGRRTQWGPSGIGDQGPEQAAAPTTERVSGPSRCDARLAQLLAAERARLALALRSLAGGEADPDPRPEREAESGPWQEDEDQQDALCKVAMRHLRRHWSGQREPITASLRKSLASEEEQAKSLSEETKTLAREAGLGPAEQETLGERYAPLRRARLAAVRGALAQDPPAYDAVLEEVIGLFADEDLLISELGGQGALGRLRQGRREGRTVIAAIAAALADLPWDGSIRW